MPLAGVPLVRAIFGLLDTGIKSVPFFAMLGVSGPQNPFDGILAPIFLLAGIGIFGTQAIRGYFCSYALTDKRLIIHYGIFLKVTKTAEVDRIQDISLKQDLVQRTLGYGTLSVETAGTSGALELRYVASPRIWQDALHRASRTANDPASTAPPYTPAFQSRPQAPAPQNPAPAWHYDPYRRHETRYWNGQQWTQHVSNGGHPALDPVD
jgi:uncharacterized membrane protein YdbT with pleckstrin-like domain